MEIELVSSRAKIARLEAELIDIKSSEKKKEIDLEKEREQLDKQRRLLDGKTTQNQTKIRLLSDTVKVSQDEADSCRKELRDVKADMEVRLTDTIRERNNVEQQLQEMKEYSSASVQNLMQNYLQCQAELGSCQSDLQETQAKLSLAKKRSRDMSEQQMHNADYRIKLLSADAQIRELERKLEETESVRKVANSMKSELAALPKLQSENYKLHEENNDFRIMLDKYDAMSVEFEECKTKLERSEKRYREIAVKEAEFDTVKSKLREWTSLDIGEEGSEHARSPRSLQLYVKSLQREIQTISPLQVELKQAAKDNSGLSRSMSDAIQQKERELEAEREQMRKLQETNRRILRKLTFVSKERNSLKEFLQSYEDEVTMTGDTRQASKIELLEKCLAEYRERTSVLENELEKAASEKTAGAPAALQLQSLRNDLKELEEQNRAWKTKLHDEKERHLLQGHFNPAQAKIMSFKDNPLSQAREKQQTEMLLKENERLKERVKVLESAGPNSPDITSVVERNLAEGNGENSQTAIKGLQAQIHSAELRNKRMAEAFTKRAQELREACYVMTGFKVDRKQQDHTYKLSSIFAEHENDFLLFTFAQGLDNIQLVDTEYAQTLQELIQHYLEEANSIPAFLAALQLQLFSSITRTISL